MDGERGGGGGQDGGWALGGLQSDEGGEVWPPPPVDFRLPPSAVASRLSIFGFCRLSDSTESRQIDPCFSVLGMGSQFSMGLYAPPLVPYTSLPMEKIRHFYNKYQRISSQDADNEDSFFMTRRVFGEVFGIETADVLFKVFSFFDPGQMGTVVATDVFGALTLASSAKEEAKIGFLFQVADKNSDGYLNETELAMIMHSSSRGFSRMKSIEAPPMVTIESICREAFNHPEVRLDEQGEIPVPSILVVASADARLRNYLSNLDSSAGADVSNLYKQQALYLRELAMIDSVLDAMKRHDRDMTIDEDAYEKERGGDIQDIVYEGLFESMTDIQRLYLTNLLEADEQDEEKANEHEENRKQLQRRVTGGLNAPVPLTEEEKRKEEADKAQLMKEARAQSHRRAVRKRQMREEEEKEQGRFGDAAAFRIGYKRVQANRSSSRHTPAEDSAGEDFVAANQMTVKWSTLKGRNNDDLIKLDVDLLEDLVEATGNIIHDREAKVALESLPKNQLGKHSLQSVIAWWKKRQRQKRRPPIPGWRKRLGKLLKGITKPWILLDYLKDETDRQIQINKVEEGWADWKTEEDLERERELAEQQSQVPATPGTPGKPSTPAASTSYASGFAAGGSTVVKAWESDSDEEEEERNCKIACRLAVGHVLTEKRSSIKFDIAASDISGGTMPPPTAASGRPTTTGSQRPASRTQTAASHIRLFAKELLEGAFRTASPEWNLKNELVAQAGGFGSVMWVDFPIQEIANDEMIEKLIKQITCFLDCVPRDYAKPLYAASKVEVVSLTSRDSRRFLRIQLLNDRDPFLEVEKFLPPDIKIKDAIDHLSLHVDMNVSLDDILKLTSQFLNYEHRCYGPQEEELGEKGMDPSVFHNAVKQRRKAALRAARTVANKEMSVKEMKEILSSRGYGTSGTISEIRERCEQLFTLQAEVCGYGELSNFGEGVANAIFNRVDRDNDGALNFLEMNALQRRLGAVSLEYPGKYEEAMVDSGFAVNDKNWLTKDGLVAYYERFGRIAADIRDLAIGSVDDYVCANISLTGEIRSRIVQGIDKIFDAAREAHYGLKVTSFISRFVKDVYLDYECKRLSDLFLKEECPAWLLAPAGPAEFLRKAKEILAHGRRGWIPEMREGVEMKLGQGWGWSMKEEWTLHTEEEEDAIKKKKMQDDANTIAQAGIDTGIDVAEYNVGTVEGWKEFTLSDGTKPIWLKDALKKLDDDEERAKAQKANDDTKFSEVVDCPLGTVDRIDTLKQELEGLTELLSKALPRRQREEVEGLQQERKAELKKLEEILDRATHVAVHHFCKTYDAMRSVLKGVHSINWGNRAFSMRSELEGFDFFHHLPEAMHEESEIYLEQEARAKRAHDRKEEAKKFVTQEREKKLLEAKERERLKAEYAEKKIKERAEEELTLYTRGAEARVRGYSKASDQKLCIEMWRRLYLLYENRYDQMNSSRDITAVAVAANNLGVVCFEFGDGQMSAIRESLQRLRKAETYMDETLKKYKELAKIQALKDLKEKQEELKRVAEEKLKEKIKQDQVVKGEKAMGGAGSSARKSQLAANASKEARAAEKAAEEALAMEAELLKEFGSEEEEEEEEEEEDQDEEGAQQEKKGTGNDEEEKKRTSDDEFADDEDGAVGEESSVEAMSLLEKRDKKKKDAASRHTLFRRRSTLIPPSLASKVPIPENIALAAAIVKFNLVSTMNEIGDPVDAEDGDERQHLMYDCFNLYRDYISEEAKAKQPVGETMTIKNIGIAKLDDFPPPDFEEWGVRTTQEDIERMRAEEEARKEAERAALMERKRIRAEKRERKAARRAKKNKKLMREFKIQEVQALTAEGGIDMEALEVINPKKAAKIRDRELRMEEAAQRRKLIEQQREQRKREEELEEERRKARTQREMVKKRAIEAEVEEILAEDKRKRSGFRGFTTGMRWQPELDPKKLKEEIENREAAEAFAQKKAKKDKKKAEKERLKKMAEEEKKRMERALAKERGEISSSSSSESERSKADSVNSDLTFEGLSPDKPKEDDRGRSMFGKFGAKISPPKLSPPTLKFKGFSLGRSRSPSPDSG